MDHFAITTELLFTQFTESCSYLRDPFVLLKIKCLADGHLQNGLASNVTQGVHIVARKFNSTKTCLDKSES